MIGGFLLFIGVLLVEVEGGVLELLKISVKDIEVNVFGKFY